MTLKYLTHSLLAAIALITSAGMTMADEKPVLTVYTYDSFAAEWGPGPKIETAFEAVCDCDLEFIGLDSSIGILSRLRLEGNSTTADVALGLDLNVMERARASGVFAGLPEPVKPDNLALPIEWNDDQFVPFDYGYFSFVYDETRLASPPTNFEALLNAPEDVTIVIQDPHTSTPGLGLMLWIKDIYGDKASKVWEKLRPRIVSVTAGWWDAYSMFLEGEAAMVLSYTTSPAYHMVVDGTDKYKAAIFDEGHYMQVEIAGKVKNTKNPELADQFLKFMTTEAFQSTIPTGNWMYPVTPIDLPESFEKLTKPSKSILIEKDLLEDNVASWLQEWRVALSGN